MVTEAPPRPPVLLAPEPPVPRRPTTYTRTDVVVALLAITAGFALTWLLYTQLLPFAGLQGFLLIWAVLFLLFFYGASRELHGRVVAKDRAMQALVTLLTVAIVVPLVVILAYVTLKGAKYLRTTFFTTTMVQVPPEAPPEDAGGLQAIAGTLLQVGIATAITVPLGILTAVYLNEVRGRLQRPTRIFVDTMSGVPSIVAGLFIYAMLIADGGQFSGFAAALALSVLMLPTVTRTAEVVLRLVPDGLREAALALGAPQWRSVSRVVLPTARTGLITATILGIARVVGETAPLIMTSFGSPSLNLNPFNGPMASLPLSSFQLFRGTPQQVEMAWLFAFVLLALVLILFVIARRAGRRFRT